MLCYIVSEQAPERRLHFQQCSSCDSVQYICSSLCLETHQPIACMARASLIPTSMLLEFYIPILICKRLL